MNPEQQIKILQLTYANVLADAVLQFDREQVLGRVTERKRAEQMATGAAKADAFGLKTTDQAFTTLSEVFGCADWAITPRDDGFDAVAKSCLLCALAKQKGAPSPCKLYCLDPVAGMVKGLDPEADMQVQETLWNGSACRVEVRRSRGAH